MDTRLFATITILDPITKDKDGKAVKPRYRYAISGILTTDAPIQNLDVKQNVDGAVPALPAILERMPKGEPTPDLGIPQPPPEPPPKPS